MHQPPWCASELRGEVISKRRGLFSVQWFSFFLGAPRSKFRVFEVTRCLRNFDNPAGCFRRTSRVTNCSAFGSSVGRWEFIGGVMPPMPPFRMERQDPSWALSNSQRSLNCKVALKLITPSLLIGGVYLGLVGNQITFGGEHRPIEAQGPARHGIVSVIFCVRPRVGPGAKSRPSSGPNRFWSSLSQNINSPASDFCLFLLAEGQFSKQTVGLPS